jgi:hypothetical protein
MPPNDDESTRQMALQAVHACDQLITDIENGSEGAILSARNMILDALHADADGRATRNLIIAIRKMAELALYPGEPEEDSDIEARWWESEDSDLDDEWGPPVTGGPDA